MTPPRTHGRAGRGFFTAVLAGSSLLAALLIATSWSARSEARGAEKRSRHSVHSFGFDTGAHEFSYALTDGESTTQVGNAGGGDWNDLKRLTDDYHRDLLWFSLRGRDYVVLDQAVLDRARALVAPMAELGGRQGRLGAQQGRLGGRQAAIGARQARIGAQQAALATRLAALALEGADDSETDPIDAELEDLGRKMNELGRQMEPLAREQEALGRRQEDLGHQMERLSARVSAGVQRLAEQAIDDGKAERARE